MRPSSFFQDRRECSLRVVLLARANGIGLQSLQSFDHQIGTDRGEARRESFSSVVRRDPELLLHQDVAGVEAGVDAHGGDARHCFSMCNRPLDRSCAAIFRQERRVEVDVAERREIEHPLRDDAAVADDDDGVGLEGDELSAEFFVLLDSVGLGDGKVQLERRLFDRGSDKFETAAFGTVGLSHDEVHAESGVNQCFQRRYGEERRPAEDEIEGH